MMNSGAMPEARSGMSKVKRPTAEIGSLLLAQAAATPPYLTRAHIAQLASQYKFDTGMGLKLDWADPPNNPNGPFDHVVFVGGLSSALMPYTHRERPLFDKPYESAEVIGTLARLITDLAAAAHPASDAPA